MCSQPQFLSVLRTPALLLLPYSIVQETGDSDQERPRGNGAREREPKREIKEKATERPTHSETKPGLEVGFVYEGAWRWGSLTQEGQSESVES